MDQQIKKLAFVIVIITTLISCGSVKKAPQPLAKILQDTALTNSNIGIAVWDVDQNKYLIQHNSNKYFIPASNTKLLTCYAAMQYLPYDSLIGLRYAIVKDTIHFEATADPSFLNDEFKHQPVVAFFNMHKNKTFVWHTQNWAENKWGFGWSWTDFGENYCQERSVMPMYYNTVQWSIVDNHINSVPPFFAHELKNYPPLLTENKKFNIKKNIDQNSFEVVDSKTLFEKESHSFTTDFTTLTKLLQRKFGINVILNLGKNNVVFNQQIFSQHKDSVLKAMMQRSDNFYAEQLLLMCSNQKLGTINNEQIIQHIKKNDFANMPQLPRWVDGSGLSRYNMFTPESMVWLLLQMKEKFGMERLQNILATGGQGTLSSLYKNISGKIFAKTGTLSNHAALSGFLITKSGKLLVFSTLTSGHQGSAQPTRKAVERLINEIYEKY